MKVKKIISLLFLVIAIVVLIAIGGNLVETNEAGHFQVKQAWITGTMSVRTSEGLYWQGLGRITTYKNVATIGFGREKGEGSADIEAIPVIFSDGSKANISGLVRIKLPATDGISLKREYSGGYDHFVRAGVLPVIRNAVKLSANLRSAQDAYTTLALFQQAVHDQLENGTYITKSEIREFVNPTGDTERRQVTVVDTDENGNLRRKPNRLMELDCEVLECVIDVPDFDKKVQEMIARRKDEAMKTELAKQEAIRAKQDALTAEEQGRANVAKAKYEEEVEKVKAVTVAQKEYEVEKLNAEKAKEIVKRIKAEGEAKAAANLALVKAGLTPIEKATIAKETAIGVAAELAKMKFPDNWVVVGGGGDGETPTPFTAVGLNQFMEITKKLQESSND